MSAQGRQDSHRNAAHEAALALHAAHAPHALQAGGHAACSGAALAVVASEAAHARRAGAAS
ncbi:hypothetical protein ACFSHT_23440 [Paraburkholderia silviterrae]|uniref:Uncharacterized protein n=1 Tax=Paraburkholderia silviterrae TaxID=2528715 RepID=A0A4R5MAW5_9BURK|nr:hypothetical protein [Paraburkholderia silviterrae]TDG23928.1 hypothetical protein EYW47_10400 [Paraburkholderia silviterrae]